MRLAGVWIHHNSGPGVEVVDEDGGATDEIRIDVAPGGSEHGASKITDNHGAGLLVDVGTINVWGGLEATNNASWGLRSELGDVRVGDPSAQSSQFERTISNNGGGDSCHIHDLSSGKPVRQKVPCEGGGILAKDGQVDAWNVDIVGNDGDGMNASKRSRAGFAKVCDNTGVQIVGNPIELETVETCGQQAGGNPSSGGSSSAADSGGGCTVSRNPSPNPTTPLWAALFVAAATLRRPRRHARADSL